MTFKHYVILLPMHATKHILGI